MRARLAVGRARSDDELRAARDEVHKTKVALGERGPVWWDDGAPDQGGRHPKNAGYADWWLALTDDERRRGE